VLPFNSLTLTGAGWARVKLVANDLLVIITIQQTLFAFVMLVAYVFPSIGYAEGTAAFLAKCNAPAADLVATSGLDLTDLTQGDPFYYTSDIEPRPTTPANYEEVTPLCDAVLLEVKLTANLDGVNWSNPSKYSENAGTG